MLLLTATSTTVYMIYIDESAGMSTSVSESHRWSGKRVSKEEEEDDEEEEEEENDIFRN